MGKRSDFARRPQDAYATPAEGVLPLLPYLHPGTWFCEPCAGDGALVDHLKAAGHQCFYALDIEPRRDDIFEGDAREWKFEDNVCDYFITNPPWTRPILHELIVALSDHRPTWLLFDADWLHTRQAAPYLSRLRAVVSVGRLKWIPGSKFTGKDNCAWYLFDKPQLVRSLGVPIIFGGRV